MAKTVKALTAIEVRRLAEQGVPKRHRVGTVPGLTLHIRAGGSVSWTYRAMKNGKSFDLGLGSWPGTTLAQATEAARNLADQIKRGEDPVAQRQQKRQAPWTFKRCAQEYIELHRPSWRNPKHAAQWVSTLEGYVYPFIGDKPVGDVSVPDVLAVLTPFWTTKNETMVRVRGRIELILGWAMAAGHRERGLNPAAWRGNLEHALPKPGKVNDRQHHPALQIDDIPKFAATLRDTDTIGAKCLLFVLLTACRSGEARGALWSEIDLDGAVWSVPGERMKAGRPHRVPLSEQVVELLRSLPREQPEDGAPDYVFTGRAKGKPVSDMTLTLIMRRMGLQAVPHGLRSSFRDWTAERTHTPNEVAEMALAHAVGNRVEQAYRRGDLFDKRRALMQQWADFATTASASNVVPLFG